MNLPDTFAGRLRCPRCRHRFDVEQPFRPAVDVGRPFPASAPFGVEGATARLAEAPEARRRQDRHGEAENLALHLICGACSCSYPIVNGTPILIDSERSVFTPQEIVAEYERERAKLPRGVLGRIAWAVASRTPHVTSHRRQEAVVRQFVDVLARDRPSPSILVIGSGTEGIGIETLRTIPGAAICEFDVYLTGARMLVADLLDLPFEDGAFDAVVAQGVLEHVIDPQRGVDALVRRSPISIDAAASYYYIGRRSDATLADREIVAMFKGVGLCPW